VCCVAPPSAAPCHPPPCQAVFVWKVENFTAFKEIMETRKIFSRYFAAGGYALAARACVCVCVCVCVLRERELSFGGNINASA
jgi:hypothetical protein